MKTQLEEENWKINKWKKQDNLYSTENMLEISEIRWNVLVLKDWWLRSIIKVFWLNLDLKNYDEQQIVLEQYKRFINWLDFPIQIIVRSTYLDLTDYISFVWEKVEKLQNDVLQDQWKQYVNFLENINSKQWLIYTKEFYVVVPYYWQWDENAEISKPWWKKIMAVLDRKETPEKIVSRYRMFTTNKKYLDTRCNIIIDWLKSIGLFCERLDTDEVISLLFKVYNPNIHKEQAEISS